MSGTRRAYNDPKNCFFRSWTNETYTVYVPSKEAYAEWLKHGVVCMGRCPRCRDRKRDQHLRTEKAKHLAIEIHA